MGAMTAVLIAMMLAQEPCAGITSAKARADVFDLRGAVEQLDAASKAGCSSAGAHATYLRGWIAARDAYRAGGSRESLKEVHAAVAALSAAGDRIAIYVLQAAEAAAQSERDSLSVFIEQAVQLESVRLATHLPPVHIISAHEAAGDLWLQVHRYDDARRAYQRAAERIGASRRVTLGLARVAARLQDVQEACRQYSRLSAAWNDTRQPPLEIAEAIRFLQDFPCASSVR
jgi:tetratricopeptide (TPR) repeat protein